MRLIIDTSSENLKVVLKDKNGLIENSQTNLKHLKILLPEIDNVLNKANKSLKDINYFSVVLGPGSFTGVRIGVSTIKAFTCVYKKAKLIGINLLELIAYSIVKNLKPKQDFCVVIKSTSIKYYFALVSATGKIKQQKMLTADELVSFINKEKLQLFAYNLDNVANGEVSSCKVTVSTQDYVDFTELKITKEDFANDLKPIYLALSQAEEELLKKEKKN